MHQRRGDPDLPNKQLWENSLRNQRETPLLSPRKVDKWYPELRIRSDYTHHQRISYLQVKTSFMVHELSDKKKCVFSMSVECFIFTDSLFTEKGSSDIPMKPWLVWLNQSTGAGGIETYFHNSPEDISEFKSRLEKDRDTVWVKYAWTKNGISGFEEESAWRKNLEYRYRFLPTILYLSRSSRDLMSA